jgi:hypothetical protein
MTTQTSTTAAMTYTWEVITDNGGFVHIYVFDSTNTPIYAGHGFESHPDALAQTLADLRRGGDICPPDYWDGNADDPAADYAQWTEETRRNGGWRVIEEGNAYINV